MEHPLIKTDSDGLLSPISIDQIKRGLPLLRDILSPIPYYAKRIAEDGDRFLINWALGAPCALGYLRNLMLPELSYPDLIPYVNGNATKTDARGGDRHDGQPMGDST